MSILIIAEIGVNHNGDIDMAARLVRAAAKAGADAVKFQTFRADATIVPGTATVDYQRRNSGANDQYELLRTLELDQAAHVALQRLAASEGVEFMSTAFDEESLDFLTGIGIRRIKIPSGEITNTPFLEHAARKRLPILLSTGMATISEVRAAIETLRRTWANHPDPDFDATRAVTVLHCTSAYPAAVQDLNLRAMTTMAREFGTPVGYSDHSEGTLIAPVAVGMGACVIEKHITLDRTLPGPDHAASIEPDAFAAMTSAIRAVEIAMGDGEKAPRGSEIVTAKSVRRGLKAARDLNAGDRLERGDILIVRPEAGLPPSALAATIGRTLNCSLAAGTPILASHLD